jgi:hypothetical protein
MVAVEWIQNIVEVIGIQATVALHNQRNGRFIGTELTGIEEKAVSTEKYMNRIINFMKTNK